MVNSVLLLMLYMSQLYSASLDVQFKAEQSMVKDWISSFKPTKDSCRALIRMGATGEPEVCENGLISNSFGGLTCMFADIKQVLTTSDEDMLLGSFFKNGEIQYDNAIVKTLAYKGIGFVRINHRALNWIKQVNGDKILEEISMRSINLFTEKGKDDALLMTKWEAIQDHGNSYFNGLILGYEERDIRAFYQRQNQLDHFSDDVKEAQEWIEKNRKDIASWIEDNKAKYGITVGDFKKPLKIEVLEAKKE